MNFAVIGINHKTAPVDIREKFYLTRIEQELFLSEIRNHPAVTECFVLSTCNRTEVYLNSIEKTIDAHAFIKLIADIKNVKLDLTYRKHLYVHYDNKMIKHLFDVASSLDSLVLGEKQIIGQVKHAVEDAKEMGLLGKPFNILSNLAIRCGKKAQTETQINYGGSSVSWAAITLAQEIFGSLANKAALIIGAGKMGELTVEQISQKGFRKLYLMNRTHETAESLAEKYKGEAVAFSDIKEVLQDVDFVICSAGAPHYILEKSTIEKIMVKRDRKLVLIDISVPRNIDPKVAAVKGAFLYEIDDLEKVVNKSMTVRQSAIAQVNAIVEIKINEFHVKMDKLKTSPHSDYYQPADKTRQA